jgi:hypothetical protein
MPADGVGGLLPDASWRDPTSDCRYWKARFRYDFGKERNDYGCNLPYLECSAFSFIADCWREAVPLEGQLRVIRVDWTISAIGPVYPQLLS